MKIGSAKKLISEKTGEVEDDRRVFEELSFSRLIVVPLFFTAKPIR